MTGRSIEAQTVAKEESEDVSAAPPASDVIWKATLRRQTAAAPRKQTTAAASITNPGQFARTLRPLALSVRCRTLKCAPQFALNAVKRTPPNMSAAPAKTRIILGSIAFSVNMALWIAP